MRVRYTPNARDCIAEIHEYIARKNPQAARRVVTHIRNQTLTLTEQPNTGRPGRCEWTRELIITHCPYIVAYRIENDELHILAVIHTSRQWPELVDQ
ncbi:MAG TPA: type II toxin-antitoxin system RelE/ParE family toxin [Gallionella sp.]|jgi:addiction module RelE/StbE family toxin|nr:type II toxin-antitoxin system RelE/ParE family toxin [Gallionella sp.]